MRAILHFTVNCPVCNSGAMRRTQRETLVCTNAGCPIHGRQYLAPAVELVEAGQTGRDEPGRPIWPVPLKDARTDYSR